MTKNVDLATYLFDTNSEVLFLLDENLSLINLNEEAYKYIQKWNLMGQAVLNLSISSINSDFADQVEKNLKNDIRDEFHFDGMNWMLVKLADNNVLLRGLTNNINYFEHILSFIPAHIYWKDQKGVYLGCNKSQADSLGLRSPADIIGKTDYDLLTKFKDEVERMKQYEAIKKIDDEVIQTKKEMLTEEIETINDQTNYYLSTKSPLYTGNYLIGLIGVSVNITKEKEAEAKAADAMIQVAIAQTKAAMEEESAADMQNYAESMAHDFKTPLVHLKLLADFVQDYNEATLKMLEEADENTKAFIKKYLTKDILSNIKDSYISNGIRKISEKLLGIVNSSLHCIKVANKARTGKIDKEDLTVESIDKYIDSILDNPAIKNDAERKLFHIKVDYFFDFLGNAVLMYRVLNNLSQNALYQISKNGKGEIYITTEDAGDYNIVRFRDTAGGTPQEIVDHMFDDRFTTKGTEGTGIGLAFCKRTMKYFGGDITAESKNGEMEFILKFPKIKNQ
jgi:signal transduction histidine kinase